MYSTTDALSSAPVCPLLVRCAASPYGVTGLVRVLQRCYNECLTKGQAVKCVPGIGSFFTGFACVLQALFCKSSCWERTDPYPHLHRRLDRYRIGLTDRERRWYPAEYQDEDQEQDKV